MTPFKFASRGGVVVCCWVVLSSIAMGQTDLRTLLYPGLAKCDTMRTQYEIGVCISEQSALIDTLLNSEYLALLSALDESLSETAGEPPADSSHLNDLLHARTQLIASQTAWSRMRDANAEFVWDVLGGGTGRGSSSGEEWIKDSYDRIRRLRDLRKEL